MKTGSDHKKEEPLERSAGRDSAQNASGNGEVLQRIAVRAYEFYRERGCSDGRDLEDWLEAEQTILGQEAKADSFAKCDL